MNYLLDTDVAIDYFNLKGEYLEFIEELPRNIHLRISAVTLTELRTGWTQENARKYLPKVYDTFRIEDVTAEIAEQAGVWRQKYKIKGIQISTQDAIIAATAYIHNYYLLTRNKKDYPMKEVKLYMQEFMA